MQDQLRQRGINRSPSGAQKQHACPSSCLSIPAVGYFGCEASEFALRRSAAEISRAGLEKKDL